MTYFLFTAAEQLKCLENHAFFFLFFLPALSHQCKGRADYTTGITLPEGERPLIKNESLWLSCAAPLPSCQQETG